MTYHDISFPDEKVRAFCLKHHIRRLALFGSILRHDFGPNSDIDVLVEFEPGTRVGLIRLSAIERELSELIGRRIDLNTPGFFRPELREQIVSEAQVQYEAA